MKKALVLAVVLVVGLGAWAFAAGPLSGDWSAWVKFDATGVADFGSQLDLDYTAGTFNFGSTALFGLDAFDSLWFKADGTLGAFGLHSILVFNPQTPSFVTWLNVGSVSIAGATLYGAFMVDNVNTADLPIIGSGALIGGFGSAGAVDIYAQATFNMANNNYYMWAYGLDTTVGYMEYQRCGTYYVPSSVWAVQTGGCTLGWNSADIIITAPFACVDLMAEITFSCLHGFDSAYFEIDNIDLGIPWLNIAWFGITFATVDDPENYLEAGKTLDLVFDLNLGDTSCITPYITLAGSDYTVSGIQLNALTMEYKFNGVTFKAGEIFKAYSSSEGGYVWPRWWGVDGVWGFTSTGDISRYCIYNAEYNEYFGIVVDGDSCCGGAFEVSAFNWFISGNGGGTLFDWQETLVSLKVGVGSNMTLTGGLSVTSGGLNFFKVGFDFTF